MGKNFRFTSSSLVPRGQKFHRRILPFLIILICCASPARAAPQTEVQGEEPDAQAWPTPLPQRVPPGGLSEAERLLSKRKWAEAAILLRAVVRDRSTDLRGRILLAKALAYQGRREEAISILENATDEARGKERDEVIERQKVLSRMFFTNENFQTYQDGVGLMRLRKFGEAADKFRSALKVEPNNVDVLVRLGQIHVEDGDYDSAAERLLLAKKMNPYEPEVRLWLGRALYQRGEVDQAVEELNGAYGKNPAKEEAALWLAEALVSFRGLAVGEKFIREDLEKFPLHIQNLHLLGELYYKEAVKAPKQEQRVEAMWRSRKGVQVALSRFPRYEAEREKLFGSELGYNLLSSDKIKNKLNHLLQKIEVGLKGKKPNES